MIFANFLQGMSMESSLLEFFTSAPYIVSFIAGVFTFFSPCVLPLIPAYLSYISGLSIKQLNNTEATTWRDKLKVLEAATLFILGFGLVFILLGAAMADLVEDIFAYAWVNYAAGGIIILFGLHFMKVIDIKFLNYESRADFTQMSAEGEGFFKKLAAKLFPFLLGLSFALGWTPCIGPIFASIISLAAQEGTMGLSLMVVYTAGLAVPFLLSALLTSSALGFFNKVKKHFRVVELASGGLLIVIGVAIATGGLGKLSGYLVELLG